MSVDVSDLEALVSLAKEPSSEKRRQLLREVTNYFLIEPSEHSENQIECFGDIMHQLAYDLDADARQETAESLCKNSYAPHNLMKSFASDVIQVAESVLKHSPVLSQDDLIEICEKKGQEYLFAITKREDIGEALSDAIVENGDDDTLVSLINNDSAKISNETSGKVLKRAQNSEKLHKPIIGRKDIPRDVIVGMYSYVAEELKQEIVNKCNDEDASALKKSVNFLTDTFSEEKLKAAQEKIDKLADRGELTERRMVGFFNQGMKLEFLVSLAKITKMEIEAIQSILKDESGKSIIVLCKAHDFMTVTFKLIITSFSKSIAKNSNQIISLVSAYDRFRIEDAKRVMRFWKTRQHAIDNDASEQAS